MSRLSNFSRRGFMRTAFGAGGAAVAAGAVAAGTSIRDAFGQLLKTGISDDSVLAKMKKTGKLTVGYAQTKPNFYLDPKSNELRGIFYDATQFLGAQTEVEIEYKEVLWAERDDRPSQGRLRPLRLVSSPTPCRGRSSSPTRGPSITRASSRWRIATTWTASGRCRT